MKSSYSTNQINRIVMAIDKALMNNKERFFPTRFTNHKASENATLKQKGYDNIISSNLVKSRNIARTFSREYFLNKRKAIMLVICEKLHPVELILPDGTKHQLPSNVFACRQTMWNLMK